MQALKYDGALRGIPVRVSTLGLAYNEALLEERNVTTLPTTFEELMEVCKQLTYTRADGTRVYGLLFTGATLLQDGWTAFARCFGGDHISPDMRVKANEEPVVRSLESLALLFKAGVLPPQTLTMKSGGDDQLDSAGPLRDRRRDLRPPAGSERSAALEVPGPDQADGMAHDRLARR